LAFYRFFLHFFCFSKRNEAKKKSPKMPTSAVFSARYTGYRYAAPRKAAAVRTIFGFATAQPNTKF
jgi:hypothetical protein